MTMMQEIDRTMTAQEKADLREFLDGYGEDVFGHYPATLNFSPQAIPDRHYYQAQGQEPPQKPRKQRSFKAVVCWVLFWVMVGEIILLIGPVGGL
jgi:hypothetical protein